MSSQVPQIICNEKIKTDVRDIDTQLLLINGFGREANSKAKNIQGSVDRVILQYLLKGSLNIVLYPSVEKDGGPCVTLLNKPILFNKDNFALKLTVSKYECKKDDNSEYKSASPYSTGYGLMKSYSIEFGIIGILKSNSDQLIKLKNVIESSCNDPNDRISFNYNEIFDENCNVKFNYKNKMYDLYIIGLSHHWGTYIPFQNNFLYTNNETKAVEKIENMGEIRREPNDKLLSLKRIDESDSIQLNFNKLEKSNCGNYQLMFQKFDKNFPNGEKIAVFERSRYGSRKENEKNKDKKIILDTEKYDYYIAFSTNGCNCKDSNKNDLVKFIINMDQIPHTK